MNWDIVQGNWEQIKGKARAKWGKLTDDDLEMAHGKRDEFIGRLRERYGMQRDEAERKLDEFLAKAS